MDDIATRLTTLLSLAAVEVRHRCGPKASWRKRRETTSVVLGELGIADLKVGRATYTLRRRIAARARLDAIDAALAATDGKHFP